LLYNIHYIVERTGEWNDFFAALRGSVSKVDNIARDTFRSSAFETLGLDAHSNVQLDGKNSLHMYSVRNLKITAKTTPDDL